MKQADKLRKLAKDLRTKPIPLKDIIPILLETADKLDLLDPEIVEQKYRRDWVNK